MIETGFDSRIKVQQIIESQVPEFVREDFPKYVDFLKQYYVSQEYQGGPSDIAENLDQYLRLDNITPEVISGINSLRYSITANSGIVSVTSTKGYPHEYGLLKIDDEIITYTGITTNTFTGCKRGFSGISKYNNPNSPGDLIFESTKAASHSSGSSVTNLSALFLKEFYDKIRFSITPGLERVNFTENLDVSNFIKEARAFYQAKGTPESFKILFKVLYNEEPKVIDLEQYLFKPSNAELLRREVIVAERISGNPLNLLGQTVKRSLNENVATSVSAVEILTRGTKTYYKLSLFIGYNDDIPEGQFAISGKTRVLNNVSIGSSVIPVDSTIGFPKSGLLISGNNNIQYTSKSVNEFLGCTGIIQTLSTADDIRSNETIFGYENGDITKKVELRITGVLASFVPSSDEFISSEGEKIFVRNIGEVISNPTINKTYKQIVSNSLIYNTSSRYQVKSVNGSTFKLTSLIDKSSLKKGDFVDILYSGSKLVAVDNVEVLNVNVSLNSVDLSAAPPNLTSSYDIRKRIKYASSTGADLKYGNNKSIASVQNFYVDDDKYGYVASNSLPNYNITFNIVKSTIPSANASPAQSLLGQGFLQGFDEEQVNYSIISFNTDTKFKTGDAVVYEPSNNFLEGLVSGRTYYVLVDPLNQGFANKIRLYTSRSFIGSSSYIRFNPPGTNDGSHTFILEQNAKKLISPQKILRKIPLSTQKSTKSGFEVSPGSVGILVNGVEIISSKSDDKIYYGPITGVSVFNSGTGYDVVRAPKIVIDDPKNNLIGGKTALAVPVIEGNVKEVLVDPQDFPIDEVISVTIDGGNGRGAILKPSITRKQREIEFDARSLLQGGGVDTTNDTITFKTDHGLISGQEIIYSSNGNNPLGISTFFKYDQSIAALATQNKYQKTLVNGSRYVIGWINPATVVLYETIADFRAGINTVGITTENNIGVHKFRTLPQNTISSIQVINPGYGYQNRQLYVSSTGISSATESIYFKNHNFRDGDLVTYSTDGTIIAGLSTNKYYYVLKNDDDSFKLAEAGSISIGATISENYNRRNFVRFTSSGDTSAYHIFKYPEIKVSVVVSYASSFTGIVTATPIVTGKIIDCYLYEKGSDYGSSIMNLERDPNITIKSGKNAEVIPVVIDGKIKTASVLTKGSEYYSTPELRIYGSGTGAILRPVIANNKLENVIVVNPGIGYSTSDTYVRVIPRGSAGKLKANVRSLTLNYQFRFENEILVDSKDGLKYGLVGYSPTIGAAEFNDTGSLHSPIIGWAYDGNPIYGPYGYSIPDIEQNPRLLNTGYELNPSNIENRPSLTEFPSGYFIEDYVFNNSGDLDIYNGRFCKTPDFPGGTYAYFAGIQTNFGSNTLLAKYPYFIGNSFKYEKIAENSYLNQDDFDFENSNLARNTLPYKVADAYADNDFLVESNEIINQISVITAVSSGKVDSVDVVSGGNNYKVNDLAVFESGKSGGEGLSAIVSSVKGKQITSINTNVLTYTNAVLEWVDQRNISAKIDPYFDLNNLDNIIISGISTPIGLSQNQVIGFSTETVTLQQDLNANSTVGFVTDIYISKISDKISVGSTIIIESEILSVLNIFDKDGVLRVKRSDAGAAHTATTPISILPNKFNIPVSINYFNSKPNIRVYFNPAQSVGIGTTPGTSQNKSYRVGNITKTISVPVQSIYLPNHPFVTGQKVKLVNGNNSPFSIGINSTGSLFHYPAAGLGQTTAFIVNQSKDYIGFTTVAGISTQPVYFYTSGTDAYDYYFETIYDQVTCQIQRVKATVAVSTYHNLQNNDIISLKVKPNGTVGIGTTATSINVKYDSTFQKLILNERVFASSDINSDTSAITIANHGFNNQDKVLYRSTTPASGLSDGEYYVYVIDINTIKLCETLTDIKKPIPRFVSISANGSNHRIGLINPKIDHYSNTDLFFNLQDSSLSGYKFKIFSDTEFKNEFVSVGGTATFSVGVGTTAAFLYHSDSLPTKLYYALEKNGFISTTDTSVKYASEISTKESIFTQKYSVYGVAGSASTVFNITLTALPEKLYYAQSNCDLLEYSVSSENTSGPINSLRLLNSGFGYKSIPNFSYVESDNGYGASLLARSKSIGNIKNVQILEQGFEYPSDKTLSPEASISPICIIKDSFTVTNVGILSGGRNYATPPKLLLVDEKENIILDNTNLEAIIASGSIYEVKILGPINGLSLANHRVIAIDNSNGVFISSISRSATDIICTLSTPILGFTTNVFNVGDEIYVEGIEKSGSTGTGFNSADYNYQFFKVKSYVASNPAKVVFNLDSLTANTGTAKTVQSGLGVIVKRDNYPIFEINQDPLLFYSNEPILTDTGFGLIEKDARISETYPGYFKIIGPYIPSPGEIVQGAFSGSKAKITEVIENKGKFKISYTNLLSYGWLDDSGKLNNTFQVVPDNDYYQNLSYTIKSSKEYKELTDTVNPMLHVSGMKNFADTVIERSADRISYASTTNQTVLLDITEDSRVDTINNFDTAEDLYVTSGKSRFLQLNSKTLSDYIICSTNRVLAIDNISNQFLNRDALNPKDYVIIDDLGTYQQYLIQITDPETKDTQITEVIVLDNGGKDVYTFEKSSLSTIGYPNKPLGNIIGVSDNEGNYLSIEPADIYDTDYDYKVLKQTFTSLDGIGIGTQSVGFIDLTSINNFAGVVATGIGTTTILTKNIGEVDSVYMNVLIKNVVTNELNYAEVFVDHDGTNTYLSDFYTNTRFGISNSFPGDFSASIDSSQLVIKYSNGSPQGAVLASNIIGFGSTAVGISTYRFKSGNQQDGTERSVRFESLYNVATGISTTVIKLNKISDASLKSVVRVSYGSTSALHQVLVTHNEKDSYSVQYPFLSIGSTSGIGTFGSELIGNDLALKFYPDPDVTGQYKIRSFNEVIYRDIDYLNQASNLEYGSSQYSFILSQFNSINGDRRETSSFNLTYKGIPIFKKTFAPTDSTVFNKETGIIKIPSHFFQTGEELLYTPTSTLPGLPYSAVGIGSTLNSSGITTNILPSTVYAIKVNEDNIRLSTRKDFANAGIYVTFTSTGQGNLHELEMSVKDSKTVIALNGVVQKPLTYTPISYSLTNNPSNQVSVGQTIISISGLSTIRSGDFLKIDNEYLNVKNVGLGTTNTGPIVGFGTYKLLDVRRGSVGTSATTHTDGTNLRVYRGAYTIKGSKIYFSNAPKGNANERIGEDNLLPDRDDFVGRVYLRKSYDQNIIYDDISDQFTGVGQTFEISIQGVSTTGIETGSGILFINDIYQTPSTSNNAGNNYSYKNISSKINVEFTGITSSNGSIILSDLDINQNQLPRGGVIVAFGSTNGMGFAPLVGVPTSHIELKVGPGGIISSAGFTTAFIDGAQLSGTIGITTTIITGIATGALRVNQRIKTTSGVIASNTKISSLGIGSVFINNNTLNSVGIGTTFTFEGSIIYGSGYYGGSISIGVTDSTGVGTGAVLSGNIGAGGSITSFVVVNPGFGYTSPSAMVPEPSYDNLPVTGVSRLAVGSTTETGKGLLVSLEVGPSSLSTATAGIGSTYFEVKSFKVTRPGYKFEVGDVIKPVGLVTARGLSKPVIDFELTVIEIFDDSFSLWQFGELDFIDSIATLQDGVRTRFPLFYNAQLLSIEIDPNTPGANDIDLDSILLIFVNGVMQEPGVSYIFQGGTSFIFQEAPGAEDDVSIYFYRGTRNIDSKLVNITETIKNGDTVQLYPSSSYPIKQDSRFVYNIDTSDTIETNPYSGLGITETYKRPLYWTKQKADRVLNGDPVSKARDSIEAQIYPTAKIIKNMTTSDTEVFVDDAGFFRVEQSDYGINIDTLDLFVTTGIGSEIQSSSGILSYDPLRSAKLSASISSGQVSTVSILDGGSGYTDSTLPVKFSRPPSIDYSAIAGNINAGKVGVGSTATATATITDGTITSISIVSAGYGYTVAPQVIVDTPKFKRENITKSTGGSVSGFSGIITGISTAVGIGTSLALKFFLQRRNAGYNFDGLENGYPIYISNTNVGFGVTSIDNNDNQVVGIGTTCLDNIYYIKAISKSGNVANITCNIHSNTKIGAALTGIGTTGTQVAPIGQFSFGRIFNLTRSSTNPISIGVTGFIVDSGLSTFPTIQRRSTGLRDIGAVKKKSSSKFLNPDVK